VYKRIIRGTRKELEKEINEKYLEIHKEDA